MKSEIRDLIKQKLGTQLHSSGGTKLGEKDYPVYVDCLLMYTLNHWEEVKKWFS